MNEINRMRQLAGLSILNEALEGSSLQALKNAAKKNSEGGYAQYVNKDSSCDAGYRLSDTESKDTIDGYKDGKSTKGVNEDNKPTSLWAKRGGQEQGLVGPSEPDGYVHQDRSFNKDAHQSLRGVGRDGNLQRQVELIIQKLGFAKTYSHIQNAYDRDEIDQEHAQGLIDELNYQWVTKGAGEGPKYALESINEDESETQTQSTAAVDTADSEFDAAEDGDAEEVVEAYDFKNGYDDIHYADEFFKYPNFGIPTGADGPVVKKTGAAGARHGDNPEQKYMSISEDIHKELVYKYRDFLKENGTFDLKKKLSEELESSLKIKLEEEYGDWGGDSNHLTFSGPITVVGTALNKQGDTVQITYSVNITASADLIWESEESPESWSSETDSIGYSEGQVASVGTIDVTSAILTSSDVILIDDEEYSPSKANAILHRESIKNIKDTATYESVLLPAFSNQASRAEQPTDESIW